MKFRTILVFCMMCLLTACVDLAVNDGRNKRVDIRSISHQKGEVYTMRGGLGGIFSKGMNRLEDNLENNYRIYAASTVWFRGGELSRAIIHNYRLEQHHKPIILVGHSLGANEQVQVAYRLKRAHVPVALLMTVDAVVPTSIPDNVKYAVNIYKPSFIPLFSGLRVTAQTPKLTELENINLKEIRDADVNHFTIDGSPTVQKIMLDKILRILKITHEHRT